MIKKTLDMQPVAKKEQRDVLPDVLKGFAAILVVLGHCIQVSYGGSHLERSAFFEDKLYQFIYSFHMPLFMIISGYYAWNSFQKAAAPQDRQKMITKKCVLLITPNVAWKLLEFAYIFAIGNYVYQEPGGLLKDIVTGILTNFWFLWAVLYAFLLVCLLHYVLHDSVWVYGLIFAAMFFTPDGLGLMACKYVLPYYLIGFYLNKNKAFFMPVKTALCSGWKRKGLAALVSGSVFLALFTFFDADSLIYLTGYKLIGKDYILQLQIDLYRFLIGLCGIAFWFFFWNLLLEIRQKWEYGIRLLAYIGRRGMGIYVISGIPMQLVFRLMPADDAPHYGINLAQTAAILVLSILIVEILRRIRGLRLLVGGA